MTIPDVALGEKKNTKTLKQNSVQATTKQAAPKCYDLRRVTRVIFSVKSFPKSSEREVPYYHYLLSRTNMINLKMKAEHRPQRTHAMSSVVRISHAEVPVS